ncbi:MAG: GNAT family N-acyltransferase [Paracoccaceae bacterium]
MEREYIRAKPDPRARGRSIGWNSPKMRVAEQPVNIGDCSVKMDVNRYEVRLAEGPADLRAAQKLRYRVFVQEMGARISDEDAAEGVERDQFDTYFDHLLLIDRTLPVDDSGQHVVGVYRLLRDEVAREGLGFYGQTEYDLTPLLNSGRRTVELGRSCLDKAYRGGVGMHLLWDGLGDYVTERGIEVMFGVASFHGTNPDDVAQALSYLHHNHLAPEDLRVTAHAENSVSMARIAPENIDARAAVRQIPSLIKAYLRLGGFVGQGAYIDEDFNTIDVCLLMDTTRMVERYREFYARKRGG